MSSLEQAHAEYLEARKETDKQRMYEGKSQRTGNGIYQREVDAARFYITALEEYIDNHDFCVKIFGRRFSGRDSNV